MLITSYKPNVTAARANTMFRDSMRELRYGRLRVVIDFHLPYYLFMVRMVNGQKSIDSLYGIDAINGRLDLYQFGKKWSAEKCRKVETSYALSPQIDPQLAFDRLKEKMLRMIFMRGVFKLREWKVNGDMIERFHIPYWIGVYERKNNAHLEVIDAVRGRFEGAKVREMMVGWFAS
jgi:hypothetical protein